MSILSDFFIADASTVPNYAGGAEMDVNDKCQYRQLTALQAGQFLAVLRGQKYDVSLVSEFKLLTPEDADEWTMSVPSDMVTSLAAIKAEEILNIAQRFADATAKELGWSADDFVSIVTELSALARLAIAGKKSMNLWNSL